MITCDWSSDVCSSDLQPEVVSVIIISDVSLDMVALELNRVGLAAHKPHILWVGVDAIIVGGIFGREAPENKPFRFGYTRRIHTVVPTPEGV
jgi:hypothetical protein